MESKLAFSVDDPDFRIFLPPADEPESVIKSRWTDFNIHDPGVTSLEAIIFAFEDLTYKYNLPIEDLVQGIHKNALSSWSLNKLFTRYAVSENDYRRVLGCFEEVLNAASFPTDQPNTPHNDHPLVCLMNVEIAPGENVDHEKLEASLLKQRAVGEYFNRFPKQDMIVRDNVAKIDVNIELTFYNGENTLVNNGAIRTVIAKYLLPELIPMNFRDMTADGLTLVDVYTGPRNNLLHGKKSVILNPELLDKKCYRRFVYVAKIYEIVQDLDFVLSVESIKIKLDGQKHYSNSVLDLQTFQFTQLEELKIDGEIIEPFSEEIEYTRSYDELDSYNGLTRIWGEYKALGVFNSLQLSFPPNYGMGKYIVKQKDNVVNSTANFRTFFAFMDQIRGDISSQMGNLANVFATGLLIDDVVTEDLSEDEFYKDLGLPSPQKINVKKKEEYEDTRLNYLLALNGWYIVSEVPFIMGPQNLQKIKTDYLNLIHNAIENDSLINEHLNEIFRCNSMILFQERISIVLSTDVFEVRILEHQFLQPVANDEIGLNFELSVFLFLKDFGYTSCSEGCDCADCLSHLELLISFKNYATKLVNSFVPAHIIPYLHWSTKDKFESFEDLLKKAYPPEKVFYFDSIFSNNQLIAMTTLMNDWVLNKNPLI